jgi:hypothetical protein
MSETNDFCAVHGVTTCACPIMARNSPRANSWAKAVVITDADPLTREEMERVEWMPRGVIDTLFPPKESK